MSTAEGEEGYNIRFRHIGGDLGPFVFNKNCTVLNLKERLMQEWSTARLDPNQTPPKSPTELRLIFGGRILENVKAVRELQVAMGNPVGHKLVTMHVVVRPPGLEKSQKDKNSRVKAMRSSIELRATCCVIQ